MNGPIRISVIGCEILEDEIVYLIDKHEEIDRVVVVESEDSGGLIKKLRQIAPDKLVLVDRPSAIDEDSSGLTLIVWIKPMALHSKPDKLKEDVVASIKELEPHSDSVVLFYGLCGNAFKKIGELESDIRVPVLILKDIRGEVVDDCIGLVMGGSEEYLKNLKNYSGTFFLTPMWADNWRKMFNKVQIMRDTDDIEGARYVFECVGYKRAIKIDTGLGDEDKFDDQVKEFAELFNFERGVIPGTLDIVDKTFMEAKRLSKKRLEDRET